MNSQFWTYVYVAVLHFKKDDIKQKHGKGDEAMF